MTRPYLFSVLLSVPLWGSAAPAYADSSWTGIYVGAGGGFAMANHELSFGNGPLLPPPLAFDVNLDGLGGDGGLFTLGVGADYQINRHVLVGAFFDYDWMNVDTGLSASIGGLGTDITANANLSVDNQWSVGGRVGFLPTARTLLFVSAGYTRADIGDLTFSASAGPLGSGSGVLGSVGNASGYFVGGGVEVRLTDAISLKGEYRYAQFGSETVTLLPGLAPQINDLVSTKIDPAIQSGRVSLNYRFNWDRPADAPLK